MAAIAEPAKAVVVDNSLFSISLPWEVWRSRCASSLLVVESVPKFLCREANRGVILGEESLIEDVRRLSRITGTLMSRGASALVAQTSDQAARRLGRHAANAEHFGQALGGARPDLEYGFLIRLLAPPGSRVRARRLSS